MEFLVPLIGMADWLEAVLTVVGVIWFVFAAVSAAREGGGPNENGWGPTSGY